MGNNITHLRFRSDIIRELKFKLRGIATRNHGCVERIIFKKYKNYLQDDCNIKSKRLLFMKTCEFVIFDEFGMQIGDKIHG